MTKYINARGQPVVIGNGVWNVNTKIEWVDDFINSVCVDMDLDCKNCWGENYNCGELVFEV